jgi:hypothetical protein
LRSAGAKVSVVAKSRVVSRIGIDSSCVLKPITVILFAFMVSQLLCYVRFFAVVCIKIDAAILRSRGAGGL